MTALKNIYRRLDLLQRNIVFCVAASVLALAACGALFGSLVASSTSLDSQRRALVLALTGVNLEEGDPVAVGLAQTGRVNLNGREYGHDRLAEHANLLFDESGNLIVPPGALAEVLIRDQYPTWAPRWLVERAPTVWMLGLFATAWLLLVIWIRITLPLVLTVVGTAIPVLLARLAGNEQAMWAFGGIGLLTFTFVLLTRTAQILFSRPNQILAVAHTVLKEASRTRIPLVFIVFLLVLLPLLPLWLDPESPLRYQIQTFISRSLGLTFYTAACMTLFLSCETVAFEIRDRQIWQLMTKPLGRWNYLLGKWLGVVTVNLIIIMIAAVSSFTFTQYLREQPVARGLKGQEDAQLVRETVLTARLGTRPEYQKLDESQIWTRIDRIIETTPELAAMDPVPLKIRRDLARRMEQEFAAGQRSIPPLHEREYVFEHLQRAKELGSPLTLRYRFHILRDDEHKTFPALFYFNGNPDLRVGRNYVPTIAHVLSIPSELIRDDGTLSITVGNLFEPLPTTRGSGALNFEADDFELLFKVGSFEANFFRAVLVDWIKLSFLAMLGICCATFLSFPVACLTSFTIFIAGTLGPFLATSLQEYYPVPLASIEPGEIGRMIQWAFQSFIRFVAQGIVLLLEGFGAYRPRQSLVEGRVIQWSAVGGGLLKVGVLWSGIALIIGYVVMRRRQLAIYSGHG